MTLRWVFVIAAVLLVLTTAANGQSIRMLRVGVVTDDVIRVADVAELAGLDAQAADAIGKLRLARAPAPGAGLTVKQDRLRTVLREARVNLAAVSLRGGTRCEVSRPADMPGSTRPVSRPASATPVQAASDSGKGETPGVATLASAVRGFFRERLAAYGGQVNVRFAEGVRSELGLSAPRFSFEVRPKKRRMLGLVSLEVEVREAGRVLRRVPVVAEVTLVKRVVVAKTPINRGAPIRPGHLMVAERTFTKAEDVGEADPAAFAGNEAKNFIPVGRVLHSGDVKPLDLVRRGDRITVTLRRGRLVIETVAKARKNGGYGDVIEVMNEVTRKNYFVRVVGPGAGEVTDMPAPRLAALPQRSSR